MARRRPVGLMFIDAVLFIVTAVCLVLLVMSYLAPYINPNKIIWFAFAGLAAPTIYIANILLMLYWAVRWKFMAPVMFVFLLLGVGNISKFVRPGVSKHYKAQSVPGSIRILSYNVGGFWGSGGNDMAVQSDRIANYIEETNPDVICFQEYEVNARNRNILDSILGKWRYRAVSYVLGDGENYGWGLAVYSKYPIRKQNSMRYENSNNSSMWVDIAVRRDTIRVFNNHLQTTEVNEQDRTFISSGDVLLDSTRNEKAAGIARKLKRNFMIRANQVDSIKDVIHDGTPHVIVCGDFNDTPMSYTYREMKGGFVDAFRKKGRSMVGTYKDLFWVFRIDYIFHSDDFETISYEIMNHEWSDHNPVVADVKIK